MQRRASSTPGATKALVGHASRQARQVPQRSASNGRSGTRSASVSTTPMKVNESVEVIRQRYDGDLGVGHDAGGVLALLRLPVEVRHGPGVACSQTTVELGSVRVRLESGYSHSIEAQLEGSTFHRDGVA